MTRRGDRPETRTKRPEPAPDSQDWIIWAAWADRVSFDEIRERTGLKESEVIRLMRRELKPSSFRLWRKRVSGRGTKHRQRFKQERDSLR
ncbi:MAG: TIGR03643 family protein [Pseudomonadota bacterium]